MLRSKAAEAARTIEALARQEAEIDRAAATVIAALRAGGRIFVCGNGGSAAEAQHFATELTGRYRLSREPLPALFLGGDVSQMSCIANDFEWDEVFARPLRAFAAPGDLLLCFSTSGDSSNIVATLRTANALGVASIAILGRTGGACAPLAGQALIIDADDTARIQEAHLFLIHCLCDYIDDAAIPARAAMSAH
jgi:D-sedoheptulose 7-phosphate isomerase